MAPRYTNFVEALGGLADEAVDAARGGAGNIVERVVKSGPKPFSVPPKAKRRAVDILRGRSKPAATAAEKTGNILSRLPKRYTFGLPVLAGIGGLLYAGRSGEQAPETPAYDPTKIDRTLGRGAGMSDQARTALQDYLKQQEQIIRDAYSGALPAVPGAEVLNPLAGMTNQMGGATIAEMQALAQRAAQDAGAIRQGGETGARSINDIYGGAAASMADLAAAGGGEFGGLTPVSGAEAVAPGQTRAAGAALGDYLRQNQLIAAQDQGFLSELSGIIGPAYASQFAMQDQAARAAASARQAQLQQQMAMEREQGLREALAELGLTGAQQLFELELEDLRRANEPGVFLNPADLEALADEYDQLTDQQKQSLAVTNDIYSVEDYINAVLASQGE